MVVVDDHRGYDLDTIKLSWDGKRGQDDLVVEQRKEIDAKFRYGNSRDIFELFLRALPVDTEPNDEMVYKLLEDLLPTSSTGNGIFPVVTSGGAQPHITELYVHPLPATLASPPLDRETLSGKGTIHDDYRPAQ